MYRPDEYPSLKLDPNNDCEDETPVSIKPTPTPAPEL
jgi:hypothetical protein